ncbi:hypothetical protein C7459_104247 [Tumebacillus permanentifrigoris]|uniref:Uncharacterized protein n=1 Tax=Tumebacillus permanentifrigoris TaxID=378543 RepID=A0A316DY46_9BACL|nr:hypothetical protein C7459_104247 [Tumebacillus permanentifrigoris]
MHCSRCCESIKLQQKKCEVCGSVVFRFEIEPTTQPLPPQRAVDVMRFFVLVAFILLLTFVFK